MKVSIITYHDEDNYGATLQAYATYKAVEELGHNAEIIDLHMAHIDDLLSKGLFFLKRYRFNLFRRKYLPCKTKLYTTVEELRKNPPVSDVYLVGSDQTWNPAISKQYALAYFLDFGKDNQKRISYASSFGTSSWLDSYDAPKETVKRLLSRFSSLLVREDTAVDICKKEFCLNAEQVVDPVLLFPSYPELTGSIKQTNDIVIYKILNDPGFYKRAVELGRLFGCDVKSIGSMRRPKGIKTSYPERIEKWVSNIAGAKYVFTDSFHGTVLSLLYHKQFVVYVGEKKKLIRITSLLGLVNLSERIVSDTDSIESIQKLLVKPINYREVDRVINEQRVRSMNLLKYSIEK